MNAVTADVGAFVMLRKLVAHTTVVIGEKSSASKIVQQVLPKHPRDRILDNPDAMDILLKDLSASSKRVTSMPDASNPMSSALSKLSHGERVCVSLRSNFNFDFDRIGRIMEIPADEAKDLYELSVINLDEQIRS